MERINMPRVIVSGLAAGLVMNIIDMATAFTILMESGKANLTRLNLDPAKLDTAEGIIPWVIVDFLSGILLTFAYAAMRPRFGPGPRTALVSGFTLYAAVTIVLYGFLSMGLFTPDMFVLNAACALVAVLAGSLTGAALYKES
jgi:hypothetical protein